MFVSSSARRVARRGKLQSNKMEQKKLNQEIDVTKFVNILDEKFLFHIGGQPREIEAKEEKMMPIYIAKHGAKHLIDKILQEKHNIKDTLRDSPLRQSLLAQILPDLAEEATVKPLSDEEFKTNLAKELERQSKMIDELSGKAKETEEENKKIKDLEDKVASLTKKLEKEENKPTEKVAEIK